MISQNIKDDMRKLAVTFGIALCAGRLFLVMNLPAPFLMGSLFGVWIIGGTFRQYRRHLGVARWVHVPIVLGLGVFIGSFFRGNIFQQTIQYAPTVIAMIGVTIIVSIIGYIYLAKIRGYDKMTAVLCAIPGGQAEAIVVARELVEKDYVVALFHLIRVAFVFITTPLLLAAIQGQDAVKESNEQLQQMPGLFDLTTIQGLSFIGLAIGGYIVARSIRMPMPHLLGPVLFSAGFHASGIADVPRVFEFVMLAQLAIGGGVGARLAQVDFKELMVYLKDALINTTMILSLYFIAAMSVAAFLGKTLIEIWLAFVPGGLYEVTLLAVIFGFEIAFIAFHHTVRVIMIFLTMPPIVVWLTKQNHQKQLD